MPQIRQEINITDELVTAAGDANAIVQLDATQFNGTVTAYLEVVAKVASGTLTVGLQPVGSASNTDSVTVTETSFTRKRGSGFTPSGTTEYQINLSGGTTPQVKAARIIIIQNATSLTSTETQIEIGNAEAYTATTLSALAAPKYWLYTSANWDGTITAYWETTWIANSSKITATAQLQVADGTGDGFTGWAAVGSNLTTTSVSATRSRSAAITLTPGRNYRVVYSTSNSKSTINVYNAKIIIDSVPTVQESATSATDVDNFLYGGTSGGNEGYGQSFTPGSSYSLAGFGMRANKTGSPTDGLYLEIRSGSITGTLLGTSSTVSDIFTSKGWIYFPFTTPVALTSSTKYYVRVLRAGARDTSNYYTIFDTNADIHAGGGEYLLSGGSWSAEFTRDFHFKAFSGSAVTKLEPQYLLANTNFAGVAGGLQDFDTSFNPSEWSGVTNAYYHEANAVAAGTGDLKLQSDPNGTPADVTGSAITDCIERERSSAMTMPGSTQTLDVNATAVSSPNGFGSSRIIVVCSVDAAAPAASSTVTDTPGNVGPGVSYSSGSLSF